MQGCLLAAICTHVNMLNHTPSMQSHIWKQDTCMETLWEPNPQPSSFSSEDDTISPHRAPQHELHIPRNAKALPKSVLTKAME